MGLCRLSLWLLSEHFFDMRPVCAIKKWCFYFCYARSCVFKVCADVVLAGMRGRLCVEHTRPPPRSPQPGPWEHERALLLCAAMRMVCARYVPRAHSYLAPSSYLPALRSELPVLVCAALPVLSMREHLCSEVCAALPVPGMFQLSGKKC